MALKVRDRNRPSGNIGAVLDASCQTKADSSSTLAASAPMTVASLQPDSGAEISPKARLPKAANASNEPRQSRPPVACGSRLSGTLGRTIHKVGSASSGLMRKIQRQLK